MRTGGAEIERVLADGGGVLARRDHPELAGSLDWAVRRGHLVRLLPGVYAGVEAAGDLRVRARAAMLWCPDTVLTGAAAARLSFWPEVRPDVVTLAGRRLNGRWPGYRVERRVVDPELVLDAHDLRLTTPALTALDLCPVLGGDPLDVVLRTRRATLAELHAVLERCGGRRGNTARRALLLDSRDEPWSEAERLAHRILRAAGLTGWTTNHPVVVSGFRYYLDIAFPGVKLAVEIDGRLHHGADAFEKDRWRQNDLVLDGWRVLRFTWSMLVETPELVVAAVEQALLP